MHGRWLGLACLAAMMAPVAVFAAPTLAEQAAAAAAEKRGAEMFAYDQAAWHTTDQFQEDLSRRGSSLARVRDQGAKGYIVEPGDEGSLLVTFYGERGGARFALARYSMVKGAMSRGGPVEADGAAELSLLAQRMIDAREAAMTAMRKPDHGLCSESSPNTLVLPPQSDGTMPVYVLSSTTVAGIYPAGGHYRFDFDADGKPLGERRFMKSCFDIDLRGSKDKRPMQIGLSHLLDSQPTEIHAFVSRNIPVPLMIITVANRAVWGVDKGRIEYAGDVPDAN